MTQPTGSDPLSVGLWVRLWRPLRRLFPWPPDRRPRHDLDDLRERTSQVQLDLIEKAFGHLGGDLGERGKDNGYLCHPRQVLVRSPDVERLDRFFDERGDTYEGRGRITEEVVGDLVSYELPARVVDQRSDVHATLDELDTELVEQGLQPGSVARPDHIVYVTPGGVGKMCPATEPDLPLGKGPLPTLTRDRDAGSGVRVSVVDTGWYAAAESNPDTPWLAGNIEGDLETVDPTAIHPYAGHGTFVAGVIRCLAPGAYIEIEGVLTKAGAVYESEITKELNEAMQDRDKPDLISISAGTYTRNNLGLIGFEALANHYELVEGEGAVLVVAAAGNDSSARPFWPAAFPWVVSVGSLDADGSVSDFSNFGKWVDMYAHGRDLVNAFPTGTYTCHEPEHLGEVRSFTGLAQWSGTSFATPVVTGLIAAHMSEHHVSARDARDAIVAAGRPFTDARAGSSVAVGPPFV